MEDGLAGESSFLPPLLRFRPPRRCSFQFVGHRTRWASSEICDIYTARPWALEQRFRQIHLWRVRVRLAFPLLPRPLRPSTFFLALVLLYSYYHVLRYRATDRTTAPNAPPPVIFAYLPTLSRSREGPRDVGAMRMVPMHSWCALPRRAWCHCVRALRWGCRGRYAVSIISIISISGRWMLARANSRCPCAGSSSDGWI
ncbi:hypothetical protein B0H16DRAFT_1625195 [Mycena metata]|uniref:Uncharacterized protein n=1 Tax=Mycena metata TaxID=1033252 RepID=A0AAD7MDX6_9AGAR|nr:hypothetical protein B0H16DRAFT_1625195 [Mycena metata]